MTYENGKKTLFNKDRYLTNYISYMFSKTNEIFKYNNMPDNIDLKKLEYFTQKNGYTFFTKVNNDFNFFCGSVFDLDIYDNPTKINCVMYDRSNKQFDINKDGVLIQNDFLLMGISDIFTKYGVMLNECEISLYTNAILNRLPYLINASDDKSKKSADIFIDNIYKGNFSIVGSSAFFDGVEVKGATSQNNSTQQNIELTQYIKASAFNEIGLNSNFNMKRERLNEKELTLNESAIKPFISEMLTCRQNAIDKINEMFNLNISVSLSTIWDNYTPEKEEQENDKEAEQENIREDTREDIKEDIREDEQEERKEVKNETV